MSSRLRVAVGQINPTVGDIDGNRRLISDTIKTAEDQAADVLVLPELTISGYPPEDLLGHGAFLDAEDRALWDLAATTVGLHVTVLVGHVSRVPARPIGDAAPRGLLNTVTVLRDGRTRATVHKHLLPDYGVFDETRWFRPGPGSAPTVFDVAGVPCSVAICEDLWRPELAVEASKAGARVLLVPNASPWNNGKPALRAQVAATAASEAGLSVVYVNQIGAQDGIVFDGGSFVMTETGHRTDVVGRWQAGVATVEVPVGSGRKGPPGVVEVAQDVEADTWAALTVGVRDYITKNRFDRVFIGLSGGIDSAVTAAVAVDAIGSDKVFGVLMPSALSSTGSVVDAEALADRLGIVTWTLPIVQPVTAIGTVLHGTGSEPGPFADTAPGIAEENIQARVRGLYLMALANKHGGIVLTTGNKSEMSVGYCTLYGDMSGGLGVLADVPKTLVYRLASWRNAQTPLNAPIPTDTITKPPSAELAEGQQDSDSLPPYPLLDAILDLYVEKDQACASIVADLAERFSEYQWDRPALAAIVDRVIRMIDRNEYKRRQAAPGIRVTGRAFGRDRRLPITNGWTHA